MRKVTWVALMMVAIAVATAQTITGVSGFGAAGPADSTRPDSFFAIFVAQYSYRDQTRTVGGMFLTHYDGAQIHKLALTQVTDFTADVENGTATFSGRGYYVTFTRDGGYTRTAGTIVVSVSDNDPDTLEVAFYPEDSESPTFTYSGEVKKGNIRVYSRSRSR